MPLDLGVFLILRPLNTKDALSKKEVGILVKPPMGTERQREGGMRDQMRECTTIKCLNHQIIKEKIPRIPPLPNNSDRCGT